MGCETYGMFGPQGLLAKIEANEESDNHVPRSLKEVRDKLDPSTFDGRPTALQRQKLCATRAKDVQDVSVSCEENPVTPFVPLSNLAPIEAAFSIEKIRTAIFSLLEPSDLKRCRLVSKSWLQMTPTKKLIKLNDRVDISYVNSKFPSHVTVNGYDPEFKEFTDYLGGIDSLPFIFHVTLYVEMSSTPRPDLLKFFNRYGFAVRTIVVTFLAKENGETFVYQMDFLLKFLTKLLTEQMPALEILTVRFENDAQFAGEIDPQLLSSFKNSLYCATKHNLNIRTINIFGPTPYQIIDALCCLAPKMEELWALDSLGFYARNKHRLNLFKTLLLLKPSPHNLDQVDALEAIVSTNENCNIEKLYMSYFDCYDVPDLWPRLATLFTKITEISCNSLENLTLDKMYFLPGAVLPRMPNVRLLFFFLSDKAIDKPEWSWLPQGISIATTFPNLKIICFRQGIDINSVTNLVSLCKNEEVVSVKMVYTNVPGIDKTTFQRRFPNAKIAT